MAEIANYGSVVALFDLDGTLCNARYLAAKIVSYQLKNPTRIISVVIYLLTQMFKLILLKAGLLTYARIVQAGSYELARLLKNLSKGEALSIFSEAARKTVNTAREDILDLLRWHQEKGHIIILVSGGFQPFLNEVGNLLQINHSIGTALEEYGNIYTGHLVGPICHGEERVHLIRRFIETCGFEVNLTSSYAYGDRVQDIPTLEMVGYPVAVYPDKELLTYAKERGWRVIGALKSDQTS